MSIRKPSPSIQTSFWSSCRNAVTCNCAFGLVSGYPITTPIRRVRARCWAPATIGRATAAPQRSEMNSRRFMSVAPKQGRMETITRQRAAVACAGRVGTRIIGRYPCWTARCRGQPLAPFRPHWPILRLRLLADIVAKLFLGCRSNILGPAGALYARQREDHIASIYPLHFATLVGAFAKRPAPCGGPQLVLRRREESPR